MGALPVFRWRLAPDGYATRRQLRAQGLRPGGQDVAVDAGLELGEADFRRMRPHLQCWRAGICTATSRRAISCERQ